MVSKGRHRGSLVAFDDAEGSHTEALRRARTLAAPHMKGRVRFPNEPILIGEHQVFLPWGFVGSKGLLVNLDTETVLHLGSALSFDDERWAVEHGLLDEQGSSSLYHLRVTAIYDTTETERLLRRILSNRRFREELGDKLPKSPLCLRCRRSTSPSRCSERLKSSRCSNSSWNVAPSRRLQAPRAPAPE